MKLNARALKCTLLLDASGLAVRNPSSARNVLQIAVAGGRIVSADIAGKSLRKAKAAIAEHGADMVACIIQGKLTDKSEIIEAGLVVQAKNAARVPEAAR